MKPGSVVRLKSGGPRMTVHKVEHPKSVPHVVCVWHGPKTEPHTATFPRDVLELAEVDLFAAASAVCEGDRADRVPGGCFDYVQSEERHRLIENLFEVLNAIDGGRRVWNRESPCA